MVWLGPQARARAAKKRKKQADAKPVYQHVTERDPFCRACHARPTTQRHHIEGRNVPETVENVCGICDECHDQTHVRIGGKTLKIYGNAEQRSAFSGLPLGLTVERRIKGDWIAFHDR